MRVLVFLFAAVSALSLRADKLSAYERYLESQALRFRGAVAVPADAVPDKYDFARAKGKAEWHIALPVDGDDRVRFLVATISDGKFSKGTLYTFGFKEERITAKRFAKLRETCPMVFYRGGSMRVVKKNGVELPPEVAVHAPTTCPIVYKAPPHPFAMSVDPCGRTLGDSRGMLRRIGVSPNGLRYGVRLEGPGGLSVACGEATSEKGVGQGALADAIRKALEAKDPARVGAVSDRDVIDFYSRSTVVCTGRAPGE